MQSEKLRLELDKLREQAASLRFERERLEGRYILRSDFGRELTARAIVFKVGLERLIRAEAADWTHLAGGDPRRVPELIDRALDGLHRCLNEYCGLESCHVLVLPDSPDSPDAPDQSDAPDTPYLPEDAGQSAGGGQ